MMPDPRISVVMPVYNAETYLQEALESILAQSFTDFELIAIDDGSTDNSSRILEKAAVQDARVRVVRQENAGIVAALNSGIALARGLFVARMDNDDIARSERFSRQMGLMDSRPEVVACGGRVMLIDPEGRPLCPMALPCDHAEIDARHMQGQGQMGMCHPSAMIRTEALRRVGGYREDYAYAEDIDLWLRLAEIGQLANLAEDVLSYRQHLASMGYSQRHRQQVASWRAAQSAAARRGFPFVIPEPADETGPPGDVVTKVYRKWGWWALTSGHPKTARHYAARLIRRRPFSAETWRLARSALRGH